MEGEDQLIKRLVGLMPNLHNKVVGDDCAVLDDTTGRFRHLLKTDSVAEEVHFVLSADAQLVGWKAVARVLSDFAAMGGSPIGIMVAIAYDFNRGNLWIEELYRGIANCLKQHGGVLLGGETTGLTAGSKTVITVSGIGKVSENQLVRRSGGKVGDVVIVTGELGGAVDSGKHLRFSPRLNEADWLTQNFALTAMMDLSDGLAKDLTRLSESSGAYYTLDLERIPLTKGVTIENALAEGEDYELLFTLSPKDWKVLEAQWPQVFPSLSLTQIGKLNALKHVPDCKGLGWDALKLN